MTSADSPTPTSRPAAAPGAAQPSVPGWTPPSPRQRKAILDRSRSIAVVGASSNPARASNFVMTYLKSSSCDFDLYPVHPGETEILGLPVFRSLAEVTDAIGRPIDIVDVFRKADDCPAVAAEAASVEARTLWLQLGLWSVEAAKIALTAGLDVVMNRCTKIEHARFAGGLHLAGFDTGVISSRRGPA